MPKKKINIRIKNLAQTIAGITIFGLIAFLLAGRLNYMQAWWFLGVNTILAGVGGYVLKNQQDLIKERRKPGPGIKKWDKIFIQAFKLLALVIIVLAILDAGRYYWSPTIPLYIYVLAYFIYTGGMALTIWSMKANNFFSSVVRIQKDRGHKVATQGPYRYVRHPGYVGIIPIFLMLPIVLGSVWALIAAGITAVLFLVRIPLEDKTLHKELVGYTEYAQKVRYRLIPGIW